MNHPLPRIILSLLISFSFFLRSQSLVNAQSGSLQNVSVLTNNIQAGADASFSVKFTLPLIASPIWTTDYIMVDFPSYTNVSAPSSVTGAYTGEPVFSVEGTKAKLTNIIISPGNEIVIHGISATNPISPSLFNVAIIVSEDSQGNIIKNLATSSPGLNQGSISVTASITTPESRLVIRGYTAPQSFITFTEYGAVSGTAQSAPDGYFSHIFSGLIPGDHQVTFYSIDKNRLATSPISLSVYTPAYQEVTVTNQLLSPALMINKNVFSPGENIIASGSAIPNGNITLFTESPLRSYSTSANELGDWTYTITNTNTYYLGDYHIHALVQTETGLTSLNSPSIGFSLATSTATSSGTACGNISRGDLNCDTKIDLTDFSIMMYYWGTNNAAADMNRDQLVDITDFSIMMYYWGT